MFARQAVPVHGILLVRPWRRDALMNFMKLVVNGSLSFRVITVHPND
jgi:hypothetical protein